MLSSVRTCEEMLLISTKGASYLFACSSVPNPHSLLAKVPLILVVVHKPGLLYHL